MKKSSSPKNSQLSTFNSQFFNGAGFTLIELLVVMAVLGVMASAILYIIDPIGQIQKANDSKRKSDLEQLQRTLEVYYNDNGSYPLHSVAPDPLYRIKPATGYIEWGSTWTSYNTTLPKDPAPSTRNYVYFAGTNGQSYWIYASLQRSSDPQACNGGAACTNAAANGLSAACGSGVPICNYGVSSPNVSL